MTIERKRGKRRERREKRSQISRVISGVTGRTRSAKKWLKDLNKVTQVLAILSFPLLCVATCAAVIVITPINDSLFPSEPRCRTPFANSSDRDPATEEEVLLIVADFSYIDETAPCVEPNLEREFIEENVKFIRVLEAVETRERAQEISDEYNATVLMWGEVASGGVLYYFEITPRRSQVGTTIDEIRLSADQVESFAAYIFNGMDTLYVIDFTVGQLSYFEGDFSEALERFEQAVERIPADREDDLKAETLFFYLGLTFGKFEQHEESIAFYSRAIEIDPENIYAYHGRGRAHELLQEYEAAIADFGRIIEIDSDYPHAYYGLDVAHYNLGEFEVAISNYDRAIEIDPEFAASYYNRGLAYYYHMQYEAAIADYSRAIEIDPEFAASYSNRGIVYSNRGQYVAAIADHNRAIEFEPNYTSAYSRRGNAHYYLEQYEAAIADYREYERLNGSLEPFMVDRIAKMEAALAVSDNGESDATATPTATPLPLDSETAVGYFSRGLAYRRLDENELAIADYNRALELDPDYVLAYTNRGIAYRNLGEHDLAIADYDRALELDPEYVLAYNNRGEAYRRLGEYEQAIEDYDRATEIDPTYPNAYWGRGNAYYDLEDYEAAIAEYREYERLNGELEPFMVGRIAEMEAALGN